MEGHLCYTVMPLAGELSGLYSPTEICEYPIPTRGQISVMPLAGAQGAGILEFC